MKEIFRRAGESGFTLVELLIVIALIAILSVAVLATINPIEQANKARDARVQNDAAEVLNAYERYYANSTDYPWMRFVDELSVDAATVLQSETVGFGICFDTLPAGNSDEAGTCDPEASEQGLLIDADELKASFVGKDEFSATADGNDENALWLYKAAGSGGSLYVCYIPKAKSNRQLTGKLYCLDGTGYSRTPFNDGTCDVPDAADWGTPVLDGTKAMFRCVPE